MEFKHDIFTFNVFYEFRNLKIEMIDYTTENGDVVMLQDPIDMTYVVSEEVYNEAKDYVSEYEEYN
tara:strand:- start:743 stop:940 length:198 start_codon:yes stop_codon:yes gene_type:complete